MYAKHPTIAEKWSKEFKQDYSKLPEHKRKIKKIKK